ncbi:MAG: 30S ribosomal protein S6, partial [Firmicutes bacterium]|nr:30S ribosomal protein S6 [Bacillota bacterium]
MNKYELMFIVEPSLDDAKKDEVVEAVKAIIAEGGEVLDTDVWGMRKLAYPIQKKTEGYYVVMHFN